MDLIAKTVIKQQFETLHLIAVNPFLMSLAGLQ